MRLAKALASAAVAGAALLSLATPASATNPPYDGCPAWALCLYQDADGAGSKAIITPPAAGGHTASVTLYSVSFLNGINANNQVSSWLNNSQCQVQFYDNPESDSPWQIDFAPSWNWGRTGTWNNPGPMSWANDHLSGVRFYCP
ncbi:peptidase inhibitor family I36 protein [Streptomyces flaveolus]|uniref:peptidase inhibitor family I36 protein n=1 Tax=Streptomyces flaveolus TaxID=67297 RepID=UPI003428B189